MNRSGPPLSPEASTLLMFERELERQPAAVRERAMARARAALRSDVATAPVIGRTAPRGTRWAIAAGLLCVASAAMGAAAYEIRAHWAPAALVQPALAPKPAPKAIIRTVSRGPEPSASPDTVTMPASETMSPPQRVTPAPRSVKPSVGSDELRLLRQARAAVAGQDFAAALLPLAEHARRFKGSRLAEEREALHATALFGLGRTDEARRAAAQFGARFPHSVLLPAVSRIGNVER